MSSEPNAPLPTPRRQPKLFPEAPPPLEPAPPPRPILRLRTDAPSPTEGPSKDPMREVFFITWKSQNPAGQADSEDFERAYGDFQIRQYEAKHRPARERLALPEIVLRVILVLATMLAVVAALQWARTRFAHRPSTPASLRSAFAPPGAGEPTPLTS